MAYYLAPFRPRDKAVACPGRWQGLEGKEPSMPGKGVSFPTSGRVPCTVLGSVAITKSLVSRHKLGRGSR